MAFVLAPLLSRAMGYCALYWCSTYWCSNGVAQGGLAFVDVSAGSGLAMPFDIGSAHGFGTGMCAGDFDGDSDVDVIVLGDATSGVHNQLFLNVGGMTFVASADADLGGPRDSKACRAADIDNDGDLDVFVANYRNRSQLFLNDGAGHFTEVATERGVAQVSAAYTATFGDYDRDGWVDLYVGSRDRPRSEWTAIADSADQDVLYRNTGGGYFQDVTATTGLDFNGWTLTAEFVDYDDDMWPDLFVTNEKPTGGGLDQTELFRNNGDGTFTRMAAILGATDVVEAMGFDFADAFNDGGMDYYVTDLPPDHVFRRWDEPSGQFVDATSTAGVAGGATGWAAHFFDYDNDGWQDLHVVQMNAPNLLFRNPCAAATDASPWLRETRWPELRGAQTTAITADFDDDGRIDMLHRLHAATFDGPVASLVLLKNTTSQRNWLKLEAVGTTSNRDAIGARFEVTANGETQRQSVHVGAGFLSGSDRRRHFGLGSAQTAEVVIHWPSGCTQRQRGVAANQVLRIVEPVMRLIGTPNPGQACYIDLTCPGDAGASYAIVLAMHASPPSILPDGRAFSVRLDGISALTLTPGNALLHGNVAALHRGWGQALLTTPPSVAMTGVTLYAGALTYDAGGVRTVFPATRVQF